MRSYSVNVFWSDEDEAFVATCPEFPGLSGLGPSRNAAVAELEIALKLAEDSYKEEGWPLPEPQALPAYSGQFRLRLPKSLHGLLARQADLEGVSLNTLIVNYLAQTMGQEATERRVSAELRAILGAVREATGDLVAQAREHASSASMDVTGEPLDWHPVALEESEPWRS